MLIYVDYYFIHSNFEFIFSCSQKDDDTARSKLIKIEKELEVVRAANAKLSQRLGDEIIDDSDDSILSDRDDEYTTDVNTRYYQLDAQFSGQYYFLTNVSLKKIFIHTHLVQTFKCCTYSYIDKR